MAHNYIIQWNCRGLRSNREDIELLISKYSHAAICLQETLLTPHQTQTFKHYSAYYKCGIHGHGGVCILVKDKFIHSQVQFQADLQAVAVCITINNKTYTVASVYVPPSETLNELAFDRMINSFSSKYLILGDFNGHSHLWGANRENERGKIVEKLIDRHNLILLNDSVHTRFDTNHQTSSLLDLSLCHPSIYMDVACEISSDRLGSDHHPIIITANTSDHPMPERVPKWNFKKAKWDAFQDQCPPKCCYFDVSGGGLVCPAETGGYISWSYCSCDAEGTCCGLHHLSYSHSLLCGTESQACCAGS